MNFYHYLFKSAAGRKGFTLIETLVAVMILSISLVVIMQLFSGGLKSNKISSDYLYGIFHAREKMEELMLADELLPGSLSGEFDDGYWWSANIGFIDESDEIAEMLPVVPVRIDVGIYWKNGERVKRYTLSSTRLTDRRKIEENTE